MVLCAGNIHSALSICYFALIFKFPHVHPFFLNKMLKPLKVMTRSYIFCILEAQGHVRSEMQIVSKLDDDMNSLPFVVILNRYYNKFNHSDIYPPTHCHFQACSFKAYQICFKAYQIIKIQKLKMAQDYSLIHRLYSDFVNGSSNNYFSKRIFKIMHFIQLSCHISLL